jgi:hypothetical protein
MLKSEEKKYFREQTIKEALKKISLTNSMERSPDVWTFYSFVTFYGTRRFDTEFTRALHLSLS